MKLSFALFTGTLATFSSAQELANIPATAIAAGSFQTLVAALGAADLVEALEADGPFTVFAPSDDAFEALPAGLVDCLLLPANSQLLTNILFYHVVSGEVLASALTDGMTAPTLLADSELTFDLTTGVMVGGATLVTVTTADIPATNGVIHVVDGVLVPPGTDVAAFLATCSAVVTEAPLANIPATAIAAGSFQTLVAALVAADLVEALEADGPFTVFAPTDDAFAALPDGLVTCLLEPDNKPTLSAILTYHVVAGAKVMSGDLTDGQEAETLQGEMIVVDLTDGVKINMSTVTMADVEASNGVIHVIDAVLVPPSVDVAAFLEGCVTTPIVETSGDGDGDGSAASSLSLVGAIAMSAMAFFAL